MKAKENLVQTTLRLNPDLLYEAKYYLSLEGGSVVRFVAKQLEEFVREYRKTHPNLASRGDRRE